MAICEKDYARTRLLIEIGAEIHDSDILRASDMSCPAIIRNYIDHYYFALDPDAPISTIFRAVTQMGHDELVELVSRKDQMNIPSQFSLI
jgi:hypothetical protein